MMNRVSHYIVQLALVLGGFGVRAQTAYLIRGLDFYYDPDTVYMMPGDSIKFQTQGVHDMVETDSAAWAINQAISNGGFVTNISQDTTFAIDTAGVYYFVCSPHGFVGMKGVLIVDSALVTSVQDEGRTSGQPELFELLLQANDQLLIRPNTERDLLIRVYDMKGAEMEQLQVSSGSGSISMSSWRTGTYIVIGQSVDSHQRTVRQIIYER